MASKKLPRKEVIKALREIQALNGNTDALYGTYAGGLAHGWHDGLAAALLLLGED